MRTTEASRPTTWSKMRGLGRAVLLLWIASAALVVGPSIARAQEEKTVARVVDMNKKALEAVDGGNFSEARDQLLLAVSTCKEAGLNEHKMMARTYVHLGAVYLLGFKDKAKASKYFSMAKAIRSDIQMTPSLSNPDLDAVFASAGSGSSGSGSGASPISDEALMTAPPAGKPSGGKMDAVDAMLHGVGSDTTPPPTLDSTTEALAAAPKTEATSGPATLSCPCSEEATAEQDMIVQCIAPASLGAERVLVYYRRSGTASYQVATMRSSSNNGVYTGRIPGSVITSGAVQFYFEARDAGDTVVGQSGREGEPNLATVRAARKQNRGHAQGETRRADEDPLGKIRKAQIDEAFEAGLHRRRAGAVWLGAGMGAAWGYHPSSASLEWYKSNVIAGVSKGSGPVGLFQALPELGFMVTDNFGLAAQGRLEYIKQEGVGESRGSGHPAKGAASVLLRAIYYLDVGDGNFQFQFSGDVGGGEGVRFPISPQNPQGLDEVPGTRQTDTVRAGPLLYGAGLGALYHFNRHFALALEGRGLLAGGSFGAVVEGNLSLQVAFGGKAQADEEE